jgi:hypothetical protein
MARDSILVPRADINLDDRGLCHPNRFQRDSNSSQAPRHCCVAGGIITPTFI